MNVDRTEAAAVTFWLFDDVMCTAYLLQEGEGHCLTGFLHGWAGTPGCKPCLSGMPTPTSSPLKQIRLDIFVCISGHLRKGQRGHQCWIHIFVGFCLRLCSDLMDNKHCIVELLIKKKKKKRKDNSQWTCGQSQVVMLCVFRKTYFIFI